MSGICSTTNTTSTCGSGTTCNSCGGGTTTSPCGGGTTTSPCGGATKTSPCGGATTCNPYRGATTCNPCNPSNTCNPCNPCNPCKPPAISEPPPIVHYIVTFNPSGGSVSPTTRTVQYGKAVGSLPTPTRSGHSFSGWFKGSGTQVTANTIIISNVTFFAEWEVPLTGIEIIIV